MNNKSESKSTTLGIRLDEATRNRIEQLSKQRSIKRSQLLKVAFNEWARIKASIEDENMVFVDVLLLQQLFEGANDEKINRVAKSIANHVISMTKIRQIQRAETEDWGVHEFLPRFITSIGRNRFGWLHTARHKLRSDDTISIYGLHSLNVEYSRYLKALLTNLLKHYQYELIEEKANLTTNTVILEFRPRDG